MQIADSLEKSLMLGKIEGSRRGQQDEMAGWHHWWNGQEPGQTRGDGQGQRGLACCIHGVAKSRTQLGEWTTTTVEWLLCAGLCSTSEDAAVNRTGRISVPVTYNIQEWGEDRKNNKRHNNLNKTKLDDETDWGETILDVVVRKGIF